MYKKYKQNVLIVAANGLGKSGVPNVIYHAIKVLSPYATIDVVVFNNDDYYYKKLKALNVNIIKLSLNTPINKFLRVLYRLFVEKRIYYTQFSKVFKEKRYEIVHSFREYESAYIFQLATKYNIQKMIIHCNNEIKPPKHFINKYIYFKKMRIIYKYATDYIGVSQECCNVSYPKACCTVIHNTYDSDYFNMGVKNCLNENEFVLTQIATFSSRKNQLFSIDVINEIKKQYHNVKLYLIGVEVENGYLKLIEEKVIMYGLCNSVMIIDGSAGVGNILNKTTFLLLPSFSEGAPLTPIEAQACGIRCFVSDYVTREIDCGGVIFLNLDKYIWAREIINVYEKVHNQRLSFNLSAFCSDTFAKKILKLYNYNIV